MASKRPKKKHVSLRKAKLAAFRERILSITKDTRIALIHDTDADGICSGALLAKAIERLRGKPIDAVIYQPHKIVGIDRESSQKLKDLKIDILFTTDKPVEEEHELLEQASLFSRIIAIDHHQFNEDPSDDMILLIKTEHISTMDGATYPATKMVYDLFSPFVGLEDLDWIAASGVIGDGGYPHWKDFVDSSLKKYGFEANPDIFETGLGLVARCIGSAVLFDQRNAKKAFELLNAARSPQEVLSSKLRDFEKAVEDELQFWIREHKKKARFFPDIELIFYVVSPRFPINSPLSTVLSQRYYPTQTVVVVHDTGDPMLGISLRRQDYKINCPSLIKASLAGLKDASGGGHIPASGGKVKKADLNAFLANLKREIISGNHQVPCRPDQKSLNKTS